MAFVRQQCSVPISSSALATIDNKELPFPCCPICSTVFLIVVLWILIDAKSYHLSKLVCIFILKLAQGFMIKNFFFLNKKNKTVNLIKYTAVIMKCEGRNFHLNAVWESKNSMSVLVTRLSSACMLSAPESAHLTTLMWLALTSHSLIALV